MKDWILVLNIWHVEQEYKDALAIIFLVENKP